MEIEIPSLTKAFRRDVYPSIDPSKPELSAKGKIVFITGGGRGLGAAMTKAFAIAEAAHIIITGRRESALKDTKAEIEGLSSNKTAIHTFTADVTDERRMSEIFDTVKSTIGPIDVLVGNSGGMTEPMKPLAAVNVDEWWKQMELNIKGNLIATQGFLRNASSKDPVLISINSIAAHLPYTAPIAGYGASKIALAKLMEAVATENPHVRVYNLHPGNVQTEGADAITGFSLSDHDTPEISGAICVYLASSEGAWLKTRFLHVNWDVEELKTLKDQFANPLFLTVDLHGAPFAHKANIGTLSFD